MPKVEYLDLLGKPFQLGARGPKAFDCWGICLEVGKRAGILYPEDFTPDNTEQQDTFINNRIDSDFDKIENPEPFAIVTFKINPPFVDHCGIILPDCIHFLHTMQGHSCAVNRLDHKILVKRLDGFYRLRK